MGERLTLRDRDLERSLVGGLLLEPSRIEGILGLDPGVFTDPCHQAAFKALVRLQGEGKPIDAVTLKRELQRTAEMPRPEVTVADALAIYVDGAAKRANLDHYADELRELRWRREIVGNAQDLLTAAGNGHSRQQVQDRLARLHDHQSSFGADTKPEKDLIRFADLNSIYDQTLTSPPWIYDGWLTARDRVVLAGSMFLGKSFVAADLAISLATGKPWLGMAQRRGPFRVVYLDRENPPDLAVHYRLPRLLAAAGVSDLSEIPLFYSEFCAVSLKDQSDAERLCEVLRPLKPDWLIVDTLIRFHTADENSNSEMAHVMGLFDYVGRELDAGIICQAHAGKGDPGGVRGASDIAYSQNTLWTLEDENGKTLLRSRKVRWGETAADIEIAIEDVSHNIRSGNMNSGISGIAIVGKTSAMDARRILERELADAAADGIPQSEINKIVESELELKPASARKAVTRAVKEINPDRRKEGKTSRLWMPGAGPVGT